MKRVEEKMMRRIPAILSILAIIMAGGALFAQNSTNNGQSEEPVRAETPVEQEKPVVTEPDPVKPKPVEEVKPAPAPLPAPQSEEAKLLTMVNTNTKNPEVYSRLLRIYQTQARHKDRLAIALKAIQNIGASAELYMIIGNENESLGDYPKALISYQFALRIVPGDHAAYNRLGLVHLKLANYHQSETAFRAAVHYSSGGNAGVRGVYYNNLGVAYEALRDPKSAYRSFQTALRLYPGYAKAQENYNRVRSALKAAGITVN